MQRKLTIGTRGSQLALWQANRIRNLLAESDPELELDIKVIHTTGDRILDVALSKVGDKGLFTKELERALESGEVDLCVHSMKDMPTVLPDGLEIAAMPPRADPRDALVATHPCTFAELPAGARVATGSLRRTAQLRRLRPDVELCEIRGNVDTRVSKVRDGSFDAAVLASAGLERSGLSEFIVERFDTASMIPAVGQGAIGVEIRSDDQQVRSILELIASRETMRDVFAERVVLCALEGGCQVPMGVYARVDPEIVGNYLLDAFASSLDGARMARVHLEGTPEHADELAHQAYDELCAQGAREILEEIR